MSPLCAELFERTGGPFYHVQPRGFFLEEGHQRRPDLVFRQGLVAGLVPDVAIQGEAGGIKPQAVAIQPVFEAAQKVDNHLINVAQKQWTLRVELQLQDLFAGTRVYLVERHHSAPVDAGFCSVASACMGSRG
jgi:hypothetical protein